MKTVIALRDVGDYVGKEIGVSEWRLVDQARIDLFGQATGDDGWIHSDIERSTREMGGTIAQGFLTLAMIVEMWYDFFEMTDFKNGYSYGLSDTRFLSPVKAGARIRARATMLVPRERNGGIIVGAKFTLEIEGQEKPALVTNWSEIYYPLDEELAA
jgi:acyl dehydratase